MEIVPVIILFDFEKQDVIVKPLDGMGGTGIFRLTADSANIGVTLEILTELETLPIMAQRYLPEIKEGDKRVLIVDGEVVEALDGHGVAPFPETRDFLGGDPQVTGSSIRCAHSSQFFGMCR